MEISQNTNEIVMDLTTAGNETIAQSDRINELVDDHVDFKETIEDEEEEDDEIERELRSELAETLADEDDEMDEVESSQNSQRIKYTNEEVHKMLEFWQGWTRFSSQNSLVLLLELNAQRERNGQQKIEMANLHRKYNNLRYAEIHKPTISFQNLPTPVEVAKAFIHNVKIQLKVTMLITDKLVSAITSALEIAKFVRRHIMNLKIDDSTDQKLKAFILFDALLAKFIEEFKEYLDSQSIESVSGSYELFTTLLLNSIPLTSSSVETKQEYTFSEVQFYSLEHTFSGPTLATLYNIASYVLKSKIQRNKQPSQAAKIAFAELSVPWHSVKNYQYAVKASHFHEKATFLNKRFFEDVIKKVAAHVIPKNLTEFNTASYKSLVEKNFDNKDIENLVIAYWSDITQKEVVSVCVQYILDFRKKLANIVMDHYQSTSQKNHVDPFKLQDNLYKSRFET